MTRRDWEFLFDQLKSISAVASYLERVADQPDELGEEAVRYYDLAIADRASTPGEVHPALAGLGRQMSTPLLPMAPVAAEDRESDILVRMILEDVATAPILPGSLPLEEHDRLRMLAELDSLVVGQRALIGRFLQDALNEVTESPRSGLEWRFRRIVGQATHLGFAVCSSGFSETAQTGFGAWIELRHHELQQRTGEFGDGTTVGVLLTPRTDGRRPWDTTVVAASGDLGLTHEEVRAFRGLWGSDDNPRSELFPPQ
jgi:hypothetical protein